MIAALLHLREEGPVLPFASSVSSLLRSRSGWSHARVTQSGVATRPSSRLYVLAGNRAAHILTLSLSKSMIYMDVCKKFCKRFFCKKNCCTEIMQKKGFDHSGNKSVFSYTNIKNPTKISSCNM